MSWNAIDRRTPAVDEKAAPVLSEAVREKIRSFFPRYDTRRAALLPALHIVQDALGYVGWDAMKEVAALLELPPVQVLDTISFYTHFWTHHKGKKTILLCRSLSCQLMGADALQAEIESKLGIGEHATTPDGAYSFATEECLAACDHAPCLLINEKMHKRVKPEDVGKLLADPENDKLSMPRSTLFDAPPPVAVNANTAAAGSDVNIETTSDVQEMKDS